MPWKSPVAAADARRRSVLDPETGENPPSDGRQWLRPGRALCPRTVRSQPGDYPVDAAVKHKTLYGFGACPAAVAGNGAWKARRVAAADEGVSAKRLHAPHTQPLRAMRAALLSARTTLRAGWGFVAARSGIREIRAAGDLLAALFLVRVLRVRRCLPANINAAGRSRLQAGTRKIYPGSGCSRVPLFFKLIGG